MTEPHSHINGHILDAVAEGSTDGRNAWLDGSADSDVWKNPAEGTTNASGRIDELVPAQLTLGIYRAASDTAPYVAVTRPPSFSPEKPITCDLTPAGEFYYTPSCWPLLIPDLSRELNDEAA